MNPKISGAEKKSNSYKDLLIGELLNSNSSDDSDEDFHAYTDYDFSSDSSNSHSNASGTIDNSSEVIYNHSESSQTSLNNYLNRNSNQEPFTNNEVENLNYFKKINLHATRVCCVCLNDDNNKFSNELLECDSCGFYVHEGCYGISDCDSKYSNMSNASTEPWFCNSCLLTDPLSSTFSQTKRVIHQCELCPNTECGILKETNNGRFVHIACALYVPGVTFQDTEKLWPVVLDEIPVQKWGEQMCSICENTLYSRAGICIKCDAGLCKNYFHVTCAQSQGLLVDPAKQNINDPFLGYCKQHNESSAIKSRRTNYLAMISSFNEKSMQSSGDRVFLKNEYKVRFLQKLKSAREDYIFKKSTVFYHTDLVESQKVPRMISTCPSALKQLFSKNKLVGTFEESIVNQQQTCSSSRSIGFTTEFIKSYFEREKKMAQHYKQLTDLKKSQSNLTAQELMLRTDYDSKLKKCESLKSIYNRSLELLKVYSNLIEDLSLNKPNLDSILLELAKREDSVSANSSSLFYSPKTIKSSKLHKHKTIKNNDQVNMTTIDSVCVKCEKKKNFHLLIDCDTCKNYYHINCLSPPLSSVPKKTKLYGWECSKCVHLKGSDNSEIEEQNRKNLEAPRSLRTKLSDHSILQTFVSSQAFSPILSTKKKTYVKKKDKLFSNLRLNDSSKNLREKKPSKRGRKKKDRQSIDSVLNDTSQNEVAFKKFKTNYNDLDLVNSSPKMRINKLNKKAMNKSKSDSSLCSKQTKLDEEQIGKFSKSAENFDEVFNADMKINPNNRQPKCKRKNILDKTGETFKPDASCTQSFIDTIEYVISNAVARKGKKSKNVK